MAEDCVSPLSCDEKESCWHIADWNREKITCYWDPGRQLLAAIRGYQKIGNTLNLLMTIKKRWYILKFRFWSIVSGADIPLNTTIGGGLLIPHPNGIVIHPGSTIGPNCLIFQQVTIAGIVQLGFHVDIGAGAKIIGPVTIGDNVRIGANSVVTKDIASGLTVAGIPAEPI